MRITERQVDGVAVLDIVGSIRGRGLWSILPNIGRHVESGHRLIVVNLAQVPSVNVDGLGALVQAARAAHVAGCAVRLAGVTRRLTDLVVITRLLTAFDTFDSVEDALTAGVELNAAQNRRPLATAVTMRTIERVQLEASISGRA